MKQSMSAIHWAMLIGLSILWGGSFFFVEVALRSAQPLVIVFLRVLFAALALWTVLIVLHRPLPKGLAAWRAFLVMGMLNNALPFCLIVWGQTQIASGLAAILNAATPFFTALLAGALLPDERLSGGRLIGIVIGFAGVAILVGPDAFGSRENGLIAQLAILGAALSYAFAGVYGRRFQKMGIDPLATAAGQVSGSTVVLVIIVLATGGFTALPAITAISWLAIVALALLSTALAYIVYFRLLAAVGATNLLLVTLLIPVSAISLGTAFLGERLSAVQLGGMAVIAIGLSVIDGRLWRWRAKS